MAGPSACAVREAISVAACSISCQSAHPQNDRVRGDVRTGRSSLSERAGEFMDVWYVLEDNLDWLQEILHLFSCFVAQLLRCLAASLLSCFVA